MAGVVERKNLGSGERGGRETSRVRAGVGDAWGLPPAGRL